MPGTWRGTTCHSPATGAELDRMSPDWSVATHRVADAQAIFQMMVDTTGWDTQADGPPVGSSETSTEPSQSTAAQNEADGHDTPQTVRSPSTSERVQVGWAAAGSVEVRIPPLPSEAAQKRTVGQERPEIQLVGSISSACHRAAVASGSEVTKTWPPSSAAQQAETPAQVTVVMAFRESTAWTCQAEDGESVRTSPDWLATAQMPGAHDAEVASLVRPVTATGLDAHTGERPAWSEVVSTLHHESPITQVEVSHEREDTQFPPSTSVRVHPPAGSAVVSRPPDSSPAAQKPAPLHDSEMTGVTAPGSE